MKDEKTVLYDAPGAGPPQPVQVTDTNTSPMSRSALFHQVQQKHTAFLEIVDAQNNLLGFELGHNDVYIGRSPKCEIQIPLTAVSREHARISYRHEEYLIEDFGSTNGTFVNGVRVKKCVLRNNDLIQVGEVSITFIEERTRQ